MVDGKSEVDMRTCEIVRHYNYHCEIHHVTTKDGYILEMHRIPYSKNNKSSSTKGPVYLQHGLVDSSFTWVANKPDKSLAYMLSDDGFDVWLGNERGNTYSRGHINLHLDDEAYWDFSFDEFIKYDLPAQVDKILDTTGYTKLGYVGHSQGTMIGFGGFSSNKILASKIRVFAALAPVTHLGHMYGLLKIIASGSWLAEKIVKTIGIKNFAPTSWVIKAVARILCHGPSALVCGSIMFLITGFDTANLEFQRMPIYISHTPAGTSVKDILHFGQDTNQDKFQMYDYGWNGNMKHYLQPEPPQYNVADVEVPTGLFIGQQDWLATPADINKHIRGVMKQEYIVYDKILSNWNHMDYTWGKNANTLVYKDVISLMNGIKPDTGEAF